MCGRFNIATPKVVDQIALTLGIQAEEVTPQFNISPTDNVPVFYSSDSAVHLGSMRWWLVPSWSSGPSSKYAMFNARAETLKTSRAYQKPFKQQRAIIPASSFIEWTTGQNGKQPMLIQPEEGVIAFAGLWDYWSDGTNSIYSCSIVTTQATESFSHIHKRMPVMLAESEYQTWLDSQTLHDELLAILKPRMVSPLSSAPVSKAINTSTDKNPPEIIGDTEVIT